MVESLPVDELFPRTSQTGYSANMGEEKAQTTKIGLCAQCRSMRKMESDRGSVFYLCQRSATDPTFPKYPRLPVLRCRGYEPEDLDRVDVAPPE